MLCSHLPVEMRLDSPHFKYAQFMEIHENIICQVETNFLVSYLRTLIMKILYILP